MRLHITRAAPAVNPAVHKAVQRPSRVRRPHPQTKRAPADAPTHPTRGQTPKQRGQSPNKQKLTNSGR